MKYAASEKYEIIRLVESSNLKKLHILPLSLGWKIPARSLVVNKNLPLRWVHGESTIWS